MYYSRRTEWFRNIEFHGKHKKKTLAGKEVCAGVSIRIRRSECHLLGSIRQSYKYISYLSEHKEGSK